MRKRHWGLLLVVVAGCVPWWAVPTQLPADETGSNCTNKLSKPFVTQEVEIGTQPGAKTVRFNFPIWAKEDQHPDESCWQTGFRTISLGIDQPGAVYRQQFRRVHILADKDVPPDSACFKPNQNDPTMKSMPCCDDSGLNTCDMTGIRLCVWDIANDKPAAHVMSDCGMTGGGGCAGCKGTFTFAPET
jgi:hypothetical protein